MISMRLLGRFLLLLLLSVALLCGCQPTSEPQPTPTSVPKPVPVLLRIGVERELLSLVRPVVDEHRGLVPHIVIDLSSAYPDQLVAGIQAETLDLALVPRQINPADMQQGRLPESMLASDLVVLVVHPDNQLSNLSRAQVQAMLTGRVTTWSDLGARAGVPEMVVTPPGSSLTVVLEQALLQGQLPISSAALLLPTGADIVRHVAEHPQAIDLALQSQVDDRVRAMALDGQAPSWEAVAQGTYPLALGWEPLFATYAPGEADVVLAYLEGQLQGR